MLSMAEVTVTYITGDQQITRTSISIGSAVLSISNVIAGSTGLGGEGAGAGAGAGATRGAITASDSLTAENAGRREAMGSASEDDGGDCAAAGLPASIYKHMHAFEHSGNCVVFAAITTGTKPEPAYS